MSHVPALPRPDPLGSLADRVAGAFADDGPLAGVLPAFEPRPGQRQMALEAADIFARGGLLLVEAGTGTGKTLAYLVPAILSGRRVLVSTGTKNLQDQIFYKDLPALSDALGVAFRATYMKGRANYLCLHRFDALQSSDELRTPQDRDYLQLIASWAEGTETGDRAEIEDVPEDLPLWSDIAATSETCLGTECPRYQDCFVTRMRQRAAESDIVIVNHHLLCADAAVRQSAYGEVIPACSYGVIDEAHQLEDVATQYFGVAISNHRFDDLVRDVRRVIAGATIADDERRDAVREALDRLQDRSRLFFGALVLSGPTGERTRVDRARLAPASGAADHLLATLDTLEASLVLLEEAGEEGLGLARRAGEIRDELRMLVRADDPDFVYFLEVRGRGVFLRASPIDVSRTVREVLLDRLQGAILTSATLSVNGSFEYIKGRLGVADALELRLPSEFDYARQAILYLPRGLPDPRSPGFARGAARHVIELLKVTEGRAFVLFTSYANLREVHQVIEPELPYPILVQGTAPRTTLLREFRLTPNAVLLATSSFWQGVDVAGEALSCVIVDKLPFASPADPITAARIEAVAARGGDAFLDYQVPLAVLALLQGLGRLIRHRSDRGVLAILDPRLQTKAYGQRFLASMPPAPVTRDLADVSRFFAPSPPHPAAAPPRRPV